MTLHVIDKTRELDNLGIVAEIDTDSPAQNSPDLICSLADKLSQSFKHYPCLRENAPRINALLSQIDDYIADHYVEMLDEWNNPAADTHCPILDAGPFGPMPKFPSAAAVASEGS